MMSFFHYHQDFFPEEIQFDESLKALDFYSFERLEAIAHKKIRIRHNQNCLKLFVSFSNTKNYLLNYFTKVGKINLQI